MLFSLLLATATLTSFNPVHQNLPGKDPARNAVYTLARGSGKLAGHAVYCKTDPKLLESYIAIIEGQIASQAFDDYDKISARILFKNIKDAFSGKEPEGGCSQFTQTFESAMLSSKEKDGSGKS